MFQQFEYGNEYKTAHLARLEQSEENVKILSRWCSEPKNILFFCGNVGTGKSYFCAAFYNSLKEMEKNVRLYSEQYLFTELKACMNMPGWEPTYRIKTICEADYLIIDDLGSSTMTDWQKEMLFHLVDLRYSSNRPTLITSNLDKKQLLKIFHERFVSRLYAAKNVIIEMNGPDRRAKITK